MQKEEEDTFVSFNLFRIPQYQKQTVKASKNQIVVGLIDASGSMSSYWKQMVTFWNKSIAPQCQFLITFSQNAKLEENPVLSEDLKKHGGGMTNILAAFQAMEERLTKVEKQVSITVVFISDGQDTVNGDTKILDKLKLLKGNLGRSINFVCLGIQNGFPTKLAMLLRELYHTGDETIPAVYLIQYASQKAFFNKFQTMSNCFKKIKTIKIPDAGQYIKEYPWEETGQAQFKEGKWVMVHKQFNKIVIDYGDQMKDNFKVTSLEDLTIEDLVDCFRGWVQKVQLLSMDNSKIKEVQKIAQGCVDLMKNYTTQYENIFKIQIINQKNKIGKDSFKNRSASLAVKNVGSRIKWFLDELQIISKGSGIGMLNEYEAAKRIGIGTITGKYHQKALALKGITVKDFTIIKEEFAEVFKKVKLSSEPSKQEESIFTLQNQKEIFQEPDFLEGLEYCNSQFDLVETFPVVGCGLKVKRHDGSMINPWKVRVLSLAKTHKTIDSMYLAKNSNKYQLNVGQGLKQEINAVLPLFDIQDIEMSDLLNTRLFKLAVSFMVVQNIDTYHQQAYMALLGSTLMFLLNQPLSEWRTNMLDQIYVSMKVTYGQTKKFNDLISEIEKNPFTLFMAKGDEDHIDIVKVFLIIFYIGRQKRLAWQEMSHLIDLGLVHYCEKTYVENQFKIFRVVNLKLNEENKAEIYDKGKLEKLNVLENMLKSNDDLKAVVDGQLKNVLNMQNLKLQLDDKIFQHEDEQKRVCYSHINAFYEGFNKKKLQKNEILFYFGHYLNGKTEENYKKPISKNLEELEKTIAVKIDIKDLGKGQAKQTKKIRNYIEEHLLETFRSTHFGILPITKQQLVQICNEKKKNPNDYQLNPSNGLLRNTCMSPQCIYYMVPMNPRQIRQHLKLWRHNIPTRFHLTVVNKLREKKSPEQICEAILKSNLVNEKKHKTDKKFVLNYIIDIAKSLK